MLRLLGARANEIAAAARRAVSEIAVDSLRITEFQLRTGSASPMSKRTTNRPARARRSASNEDATRASTHQATAASATCAQTRSESVGKIL